MLQVLGAMLDPITLAVMGLTGWLSRRHWWIVPVVAGALATLLVALAVNMEGRDFDGGQMLAAFVGASVDGLAVWGIRRGLRRPKA